MNNTHNSSSLQSGPNELSTSGKITVNIDIDMQKYARD